MWSRVRSAHKIYRKTVNKTIYLLNKYIENVRGKNSIIFFIYLYERIKAEFSGVSFKMEGIYQTWGARLYKLSESTLKHPISEQLFWEVDQYLFRDGITLAKVGVLLSFAKHIIDRNPEKKDFVYEQVYKNLRKYFPL